MKLFVYTMREFDEKRYFDDWCQKLGIEYDSSPEYPELDNLELASGYDAISFTPVSMGEDKIRRLHELGVKCLACRSIGYNHVDLDTCRELGMSVTHLFYPPRGVANYAIMMMLMCCRRMRQIMERNIVQDFTLEGKLGMELSNCTVAVLGTGKIGATVLKHLSGFGCKLLAYDIHHDPHVAEIAEYVDLDTIWREADIISLHMAATEENYHIINADSLSRMKEGVILINTARGVLVDTTALIDAIEGGRVGAAALDVLENEDGLYYADLKAKPIANREMAILKAFPNVILTPHTAFYTDEAVEHMAMNTVKGVVACLNGEENPFLVKE